MKTNGELGSREPATYETFRSNMRIIALEEKCYAIPYVWAEFAALVWLKLEMIARKDRQ